MSRKRSVRVYSSPAKSSKSQPFAIVTTGPRGEMPRVSTEIDSAAVTIASACAATRCATAARDFRFTSAAKPSAERCGCSTIESRRSATHFTPVAFFTAAPSEMNRAGRRRRQHDVDPLAAHDRDRLRDRGRVPGHVLVRHEQPAADRRRLQQRELHPGAAVLLVGDPPAARPDVARAVHPRLRRQRQVGVDVHPLRVVRREHVRLDPERGQMARELQRSLHAARRRRAGSTA